MPKKRANGEGSIRKRKDGRWEGRYAALVFSNTPHVAQPKKAKSPCLADVEKGIKNQAWDITYITAWSMQY